ncbi:MULTISPECIES: hypothetical protein [Bacteria]|uniref:hypothetical protein n=1 Tax=Pseudomonadati TaxID=3379134 RepID=UPI0002E421D4|nr:MULTISPECIES: hypothetical protein [Bacteria]
MRRAQLEMDEIREVVIRELTALPGQRRLSESEAEVEIHPSGFDYYDSMFIVNDVLFHYGFLAVGGHHLPYGTCLWWREDGVMIRMRTDGETFNPMTQLEVLVPLIFPTYAEARRGEFVLESDG